MEGQHNRNTREKMAKASSGDARKMVVNESEKSQKVQMSNWIQDAKYERSVKALSRSEKSIVGKITVEQKLLCRRYNHRLNHSKLIFARITGNREMEKEILGHVSLNTEVGYEGEHDEMLFSIRSAGSLKLEQIRRMRSFRKSLQHNSQFKLRIRSLKEDDDRDEQLEEACISRPVTARTIRPPVRVSVRQRPHTAVDRVTTASKVPDKDTVKDAVQISSKLDVNPNNSKGEQQINSSNVAVNEKGGANIAIVISDETDNELDKGSKVETANTVSSGKMGLHKDIENNTDNSLATIEIVNEYNSQNGDSASNQLQSDNQKGTEETNVNHDNTDNNVSTPGDAETASKTLEVPSEPNSANKANTLRPHTVTGEISPYFSASPAGGSRRVSISSQHRLPKRNTVKIGSLFQEEKKPTLVDIQKMQVKLANYEKRIKDFGDGMSDINLKNSIAGDYYNIRLASLTQSEEDRKRKYFRDIYEELLSSTESERRKWKGNISIRSLTGKSVSLDYKSRPVSSLGIC